MVLHSASSRNIRLTWHDTARPALKFSVILLWNFYFPKKPFFANRGGACETMDDNTVLWPQPIHSDRNETIACLHLAIIQYLLKEPP